MAEDLPARCHSCLVRDSSICAALCDRELVKLSRIARRKVFKSGEPVSWEGEENTLVANIVSGNLKLVRTLPDGKEHSVGILGKGDFYGRLFEDSNDVTAIALQDTDLCLFPRAQFEHVMDDQPKLERMLFKRTFESLHDARDRQLMLARKAAASRVAAFLLQLIDGVGGDQLELPMSRGDIADFLGLTIETVSRQFTDLKASGVIDAGRGSRKIVISDLAALRRLAAD